MRAADAGPPAAPWRRLLLACLLSLLAYAALFGFVLDRPLAYGFLSGQLEAKLARGSEVAGPKLVILAGSNGPYSHRCTVIGPIVGRPCINGGVAVGIGLDYLFARWRPLLHPGDVVYMPMEEAQYARPRGAVLAGTDAAIMFRHDWRTLAELRPDRWAGALFAFDLRYAVMALIERALLLGGFHDPRRAAEGGTNEWGDHVGHTPALGAASQAVLAHARPVHQSAAEISGGDGAAEIARFVGWARSHDVTVIGGLPTEFADSPMSAATRAAIRTLYESRGAAFLELQNRSLYPRTAFFDTPDHLSEPWQISHSRQVAEALGIVYKSVTRTHEVPIRTNIEIDDELMTRAQKAAGLRTKKATVEEGLRLLVRLREQEEILRLAGKVRWEGDLAVSREGRSIR